MKTVTRIHTCIISREVLDYVIAHAKDIVEGEGFSLNGHHVIEFIPTPPPERLVSMRTVVPAHPLKDGSVMTRIEVTEREDES